ncbi:MAG: hypothetical protein ACRYGK_05060 [Janthinobacterium lividum]
MLSAVETSASSFPILSANVGAAQTDTPVSATAPLPVAASQAANPAATAAANSTATLKHRQAFIQFHVEAALDTGHAPGMIFHGFKLESRDTYVALRLRGKVEQGAAQHAVAEWNRLASAHVNALAATGFDNHRQQFLKDYVDLVIEGGVAPGLVHSGINIENRRAYVVSRINGNFGNDTAVQAQAQWNQLASDHIHEVAGNLYIRLHPLPVCGAPASAVAFAPQALLAHTDALAKPAQELRDYRLKQLSQGSGPAAALHGLNLHAEKLPSAQIICDPAPASPAQAMQADMPAMPVKGEEFSADHYAVLRKRHKSCSRAFLEEFMRRADDTLLFQIYIDPDMQGNPHDLQDMASKTLFSRRP